MNEQKDNILFDNFSINDLYKKIYLNHNEKEELIRGLLEELKLLIVDATGATLIGPIVKDLAEASVKNDDSLIKLATAAIRLLQFDGKANAKLTEGEVIEMSKEEQNELLARLDNIQDDLSTRN